MNESILYALDFDGVICDSAVETGMTGWKAARTLWTGMPESPPQTKIEQFRSIRPIIETGYEAILAMRLMSLGESTDAIFSGYQGKIEGLMAEAHVGIDELKQLFGATRDSWIEQDLASWVAMNPLFPGVAEKLRRLGQQHVWYVITTKQERFVKQILKANAIELADERIFGLDRNMSKTEVLKGLLNEYPQQTIHFYEDRLPTLMNVLKLPELAKVKLLFALWGYNTVEDKALAAQQTFSVQQLNEFLI